MVANVTLRLLKPQCDLDPEWSSEPIQSQIKRAIAQLFDATVAAKRNHEISTGAKKAFAAPTFAYCFYLLKGVLKGEYKYSFTKKLFSCCFVFLSWFAWVEVSQKDFVL